MSTKAAKMSYKYSSGKRCVFLQVLWYGKEKECVRSWIVTKVAMWAGVVISGCKKKQREEGKVRS